MMSSWSISGVPRTIHTTILTNQLSGLKRLIEPSEIISPSGIAPSRVSAKISSDFRKPSDSELTTVWNMAKFLYLYYYNIPALTGEHAERKKLLSA